ncbi:MAG: hypothetical protein O2816_16980, partial [Planctomycetota bacterium]|nr:hypothetical protein [Planctomycetota bacterium]
PRLILPLTLLVPAFGQQGPQLRPEGNVIALENGGTHDLWGVDHRTWSTELQLVGVQFQGIELVGYSELERLREDLPRALGEDLPYEGIRLPGNAQLLHVTRAGRSELLVVDGIDLRTVFSVPANLLQRMHVSPDGRYALVASTSATGGNVWRVDLERGTAKKLTKGMPALQVDSLSLRTGSGASWFLANGQVHVAVDAAAPVDLGATPEETALPDLLLATGGQHALVLLEEEEDLRRIVRVDAQGQAVTVTPTAGAWSLPGFEDPLGPYLAISADGTSIAWRETTDEGKHEIHVSTAPGQNAIHLTREPEFPAYIDNVGVIGFFGGNTLAYLAGDVTLSPVQENDVIGAADMYAAEVLADGTLESRNLTRTSGQTWPPFVEVGQLVVENTVLDPRGERIVFDGPADPDQDSQVFACFKLGDTLYGHGPNLQILEAALDDSVDVFAGQSHLVAVTKPAAEGLTESRVQMLRPFLPGEQQFVTLAEFAEEVELTSVATNGNQAAFLAIDEVEEGSPLTGIPWRATLIPGEAEPLLSASVKVTGSLAVTGLGDVLLNVHPANQPAQFVRIGAWNQVVPLEVPEGTGFLLAN